MYNAIVHESGHYPADKIEERITFALIHARLNLSGLDDERYDKSDAANTFYIFCGGGVSSSLLSAITFSVLDPSNVVCC